MRGTLQADTTSALLVGLLLSPSCGRKPDVDRVDQALKQAKIDDVNVAYDKNDNIIHLTGSVERTVERQHAEQVATAVVDSAAKVLNAITVEDVDYFDRHLRLRLYEAVDRETNLAKRNIDFDVNNGVVTAKGTVQSTAEKNQVGELVKAAPGVKHLANELEIGPEQ